MLVDVKVFLIIQFWPFSKFLLFKGVCDRGYSATEWIEPRPSWPLSQT